MNKFLKIFFLVAISVLVVNCNNNDDEAIIEPEVLRVFQTQYNDDLKSIEQFLKENKVTVDNDLNATFTRVVLNDPSCIFTENQNNATNPTKLLFRMVNSNGVDYKLYYLQINKGGGARPTSADNILHSYQGNVIENLTTTLPMSAIEKDVIGTQFDISNNPETNYSLPSLIRAWAEVFPQFNGALITTNSNGGKVYNNFGSGVMFVPSGLGYYNVARTNIPQYSNLLFKFKLNDVIRTDNDGDGILSVNEDLNGDYYFDITNDDTDNDGIVDAADRDDDGDNFLTLFEIKKPAGSSGSANYLFNDIPKCSPGGKKRHLDPNCHD
jgi:FKBP-type peptidyl-prolyl cis-trans isomerase